MIEEIRVLIAQAKTEKAIELAFSFFKNDRDVTKTLLLLSSSYNQNKRGKNMGVLSESDYSKELNRINYVILDLFGDGDSDVIHVEPPQQQKSIAAKIDPISLQFELTKERVNTPSEYAALLTMSSDIITFLKQETDYVETDRLTHRLFLSMFQPLQWAFDDFNLRQNEANAGALIKALYNQQIKIIGLLQTAVKESPIENLLQNAREANYETFVEKFRLYLEKAMKLKKVSIDALELFNEQFNDLQIVGVNAFLAEIRINKFKKRILAEYGI